MIPFYQACEKVLQEIRASVYGLIQKYLSGDASTGKQGSLNEYIEKVASGAVDAIKADVNTLTSTNTVEGGLRIYTKTYVSNPGLVIAANTKILAIYAVSNGISVPVITIDSIALDNAIARPTVIDATTGVVGGWVAEVPINGSWASTTQVTFANTNEIGCVYIQPQTTTAQVVV